MQMMNNKPERCMHHEEVCRIKTRIVEQLSSNKIPVYNQSFTIKVHI